MLREWNGTQTVVADGRVAFLLELILGFNDGPVRGAESQEADFCAVLVVNLRLRDSATGFIVLLCEPVHVVLVVVRPFAVERPLVVAAAAREVRRRGVIRSGKGAIADTIAIH